MTKFLLIFSLVLFFSCVNEKKPSNNFFVKKENIDSIGLYNLDSLQELSIIGEITATPMNKFNIYILKRTHNLLFFKNVFINKDSSISCELHEQVIRRKLSNKNIKKVTPSTYFINRKEYIFKPKLISFKDSFLFNFLSKSLLDYTQDNKKIEYCKDFDGNGTFFVKRVDNQGVIYFYNLTPYLECNNKEVLQVYNCLKKFAFNEFGY